MRGFNVAFDEPCLAALLRDITTCDWGGYGRDRCDEGYPRAWYFVELCAPGFVPPARKVREVRAILVSLKMLSTNTESCKLLRTHTAVSSATMLWNFVGLPVA